MQSIYHLPFKTAVAAAQVLMPLLQLQRGAITSERKVIDNGIFRPLGGIKSFCSWLARWMRKNSEFWVRMSAIQLCLSTIFLNWRSNKDAQMHAKSIPACENDSRDKQPVVPPSLSLLLNYANIQEPGSSLWCFTSPWGNSSNLHQGLV